MAQCGECPPARGMAALCHRLPKVELHAHLHGSARLCTIADLAPPGVDQALLTSDTERSLEGCFAIFGAIHRTVTTLAAVRRITAEVLADFAADNVKYLELRTTPRALAGNTSPAAIAPVSRRPSRGPPPRLRAQMLATRANPDLGLTPAQHPDQMQTSRATFARCLMSSSSLSSRPEIAARPSRSCRGCS